MNKELTWLLHVERKYSPTGERRHLAVLVEIDFADTQSNSERMVRMICAACVLYAAHDGRDTPEDGGGQ